MYEGTILWRPGVRGLHRRHVAGVLGERHNGDCPTIYLAPY
jgi:hypothetical protein